MKSPKSCFQSGLNRRHFLRAGATALALPALEALPASAAPQNGVRTFVSVGTYLGWHAPAFYPKQTGAGYEMPPLLQPLEEHREHFTVFSGLDHRAPNGHEAWCNYLTGNVPGSYSVDQIIADELGQKSRFPSIHLIAGASEHTNGRQMSYTKQGVPMPEIERPSVLYKKLFMSQADRARAEYVLTSGKSALDSVVADAKRLQANLPASDRDKLGDYFESIRSVERRMNQQISSINEPIPQPNYKLPESDPITPNLLMEAEQVLYDLMALAIQTESTRVITFGLYGLGQVFTIDGTPLSAGYHALSHHGNDPAMVRDLVKLEGAHMQRLSGFLRQLREKKDAQDRPLLDSTIVLVGTGMGDASRHSNQDLPTLVAGGGFQHGRHLAIDRSANDAPLLGDLYITLMQRLGMETETFSNASRNMNQLFS
ncbi:MAG: DUF1552 domain-containing protein [Acidobacteria bacterium]|nr:DUF1552 domain-containing protein [Acidobacteriota bacterium]